MRFPRTWVQVLLHSLAAEPQARALPSQGLHCPTGKQGRCRLSAVLIKVDAREQMAHDNTHSISQSFFQFHVCPFPPRGSRVDSSSISQSPVPTQD